MTTVIPLSRSFIAGFEDLVPRLPPQFSIVQISLSSIRLSLSLSGVDCSLALWNEVFSNHLMNFVLPRSICFSLELHFMHFVLFDILFLYYWNLITSRKQIDGVCSKLIPLFVMVSAIMNIETELYYFLHVLDKRWMGHTSWSCTKMKRKEKPRQQLLWISAQK